MVSLIGRSKQHDRSKHYGSEIIELLNHVWPVLRSTPVANDGINWAVYEVGDRLFAGVASDISDPARLGLEGKSIRLEGYAEWKHIGPYSKLGEVCVELNRVAKQLGLAPSWPLVEVYGHWTEDESKLETTILLALA